MDTDFNLTPLITEVYYQQTRCKILKISKVERSHRIDEDEFYQLLICTNEVDHYKKLDEWEKLYNFNRPHIT